MLEMVSSLASAGVWPSIPFVGFLVTQKLSLPSGLPFVVRFTLHSLIGIACWSVVLLGTAGAGVMYGPALGVLGWVAIIGAISAGAIKSGTIQKLRTEVGVRESVFILILAIVLVWNMSPRESLIGGRDMGVYSTHAMYIAHHHQLFLETPWTVGGDTAFIHIHEIVPGFTWHDGMLTVQFAKLYPIWLAQGFNSFGFEGLIRVNFLMGAIGLLVIYCIALSFLSVRFALLLLVLAGLNPGTIWVTHATLSETLAGMLVWGFVLFLMGGLTYRHKGLAGWAGLLLGLTMTVRIDSYLLITLVFGVNTLCVMLAREREEWQPGIWAAFYRVGFPAFFLGVIYNLYFNLPYVLDLLPQIAMLNYLMVASGLVLALTVYVGPRKQLTRLFNRNVIMGFGVLLFTLVLYGFFIRPIMEPFSIGKLPNGTLVRDLREETIRYLSKYLGYIVVFLAPAGFSLLMLDVVNRRNFSQLIPGILWLGFALLYCYNPSIAPDHFWAIRRFVPVVIPGFAAFGLFALSAFLDRIPSKFNLWVFAALVIYSVSYFVPYDMILVGTRENEGFYRQISRFADKLPSNTLILSDDGAPWARWETPLMFAFDKKIVPLDFDDSLTQEVVGEWISGQLHSGKHVFLLNEGTARLNGLNVVAADSVNLRRSIIESTTNPIPDSLIIDDNFIRLYEISGYRTNYSGVRLGGSRYWSVREYGFYNEPLNRSAARWTADTAGLVIPTDTLHPPRAVKFEITASSPHGTRLVLKSNETIILNDSIGPGHWVRTIPLKDVGARENMVFDIQATPFVPSRVNPGSGDSRTLGVSVAGVTLLDSYQTYSSAPLPASAYHSSIKVRSGRRDTRAFLKMIPISIVVQNLGAVVWPSPAELESYKGAVRIGIQWLAHGDEKVLLDQRADLPEALAPGDSAVVTYTLSPFRADGSRLGVGTYDIRIGMLQEGETWFVLHGDKQYKGEITLKD